jgi:hypothetical protein
MASIWIMKRPWYGQPLNNTMYLCLHTVVSNIWESREIKCDSKYQVSCNVNAPHLSEEAAMSDMCTYRTKQQECCVVWSSVLISQGIVATPSSG